MKTLITICVLLVLLAICTSSSFAGTVTIGRGLYESRGGYQDGEFIITPTGVPGLADGIQFGSFCIEMTETISVGGTYNANVNTAAIKGSTSTNDPLSPQTAWLFYQYAVGNIIIDTGAKATDFQYAIWKLEDEDTQAPSAWATITWTAAAEAYYQMALGSNWADIGPVRVLNLGSAPDYPVQDVLAVPEPATLMLLGLGCLTLIRKRK